MSLSEEVENNYPKKSHEYVLDREVLTSLESIEQSVLQHIRTSGLPRAKESFLVNEFLEYRRTRKRVFNDLIKKFTDELQASQMSCEELKKSMETGYTSQISEIQSLLADKNNEINELKETFLSDIKKIEERELKRRQEDVKATQKKYEAKIIELERRFSELQHTKKMHDSSLVPKEELEILSVKARRSA